MTSASPSKRTKQQLLEENRNLANRLKELEETLEAVRHGTIDALVVSTSRGEKVKVLGETDHPYRILAKSMREGAVTLLGDGTIFYCNPRFAEMVGRPERSLVGSSFPEYFKEEDRAQLLKSLKRSGRSKSGDEFELETGGRAMIVRLSFLPMVMEEVQAVLVIISDVTGQREMERRFQALIERAPDGIVLVGMNGRIIFASPSARNMFGYGPEETPDFDPANQTHPDDLGMVLATLSELIENPDQTPTIQYRFKNRNGDWLWVESTFTNMLAEPAVQAIVINFREITEHRQAREQINFQASLLGAVGSAVIATDLTGRVLYWNRAAENLYGWSSAEAVGRPILELTPSQQTQEQARTIMEKHERGESWSGEFLVQRRDGTTFPAFVSNSPIHDTEGRLIGIIGVSNDITPMKQAEEALRRSEQRHRELVENFPNGIVSIFNRDLRLVFTDGMELKSLGLSPAEFHDRHFSELVPPESWKISKPHLEAAFEGQASTFEIPYWDDRHYIINVTPLRHPDGGIHEIYVVTQNVTERYRLERDIRERIKELRCLFQIQRDMQDDISLNELCERVLAHIVEGMQFPELTAARIELNDNSYSSPLYTPALDHDLRAEIRLRDRPVGELSVYYIKEKPFLLPEEANMVESIAQSVGKWLAQKQAEASVYEKITALKTLGEIQRDISAGFETETILNLLCRRVSDLLDIPKAAIVVGNNASKMEMSAHLGLVAPELVQNEFASQWDRGFFPKEDVRRQTMYMPEIPPDFPIMPEFRRREKVEAMAISPLYTGEILTGALIVLDTRTRNWTTDEIQMLELLAGQAASTLEKIRLFNQEKQRRAELAALYQLSEKLGGSNEFDEIVKLVVKGSVDMLHITFARILLLEENEFVVRAEHTVRDFEIGDRPTSAPSEILPFTLRQLTAPEPIVIDRDSGGISEPEGRFLLLDLVRSLCMVPLKIRKNPLGLLVLGEARNQKREPISDDKLRLAAGIGEQTSGAIYRTQLYRETDTQLMRMQALNTIDQAITGSFDIKLVLNVLTQQARLQLNMDAVAVHLFDPILHTLEFISGTGFRTNEIGINTMMIGEGLIGRVAQERQMLFEPDVIHAAGLKRKKMIQKEGFVSYSGIPLIAKGKLVGVLESFHRSPFKFTEDWIGFYKTMAGQAAIAIDNGQLFENLQRSNAELERRVAERTAELNHANAELEFANRAKDEFLANMSHELRTPLNSILGMSEMLLEQQGNEPLSRRQERYLQVVESSGRHLLEMINDILDLSKIEAGKLEIHPELVEVDRLVESCLTLVKSLAMKKSIHLTFKEDPPSLKVQADPQRLKQILVNLLTNAIKFTPEHGEVMLQVQGYLEQEIIRFSVLDTGVGIAPEDLKRLFRPFVQVDSSLNRRHEGTGLGLALVQKLTDLHGGSVEVESEVDKGSRFTINIPWDKVNLASTKAGLSAKGQPEKEQADGNSEPPVRQGTILLAEDNEANILTIGEYLKGHGYQVRVAHDGIEAIKKSQEESPHLILMDIQMPVMDGLEAIAALRTDPRFASTPIIALTALAMPGDRERTLAAGADEYMSKPVSLRSLRQTIQKLLTARKS